MCVFGYVGRGGGFQLYAKDYGVTVESAYIKDVYI